MLSAIILLENLRWAVPTTFMIGAAPAYLAIWSVWRTLSSVLPRGVYVKGDDFLFSTYHRNLLFFFETLTEVELIFYGDVDDLKEMKENTIYISNHQSTMDWVVASCVAMRRGSLGSVRYVLKDGLRFLPFYGFYLGMHGSLFVKRGGKFDKGKAQKQLSRDADDKKPEWLVIYPEGTRYNPELKAVLESSKKFAVEQGFNPLNNVLFPRVRAMQVCIEQLRINLGSVFDVTIAYGDRFDFKSRRRLEAPTMQDFLSGKSRRVHIYIKRIPINDVPTAPSELKNWLYSRFQDKDRLLQEFYSANSEVEACFPGAHVVKPLSLSSLIPSMLLWSGTFALFNVSRVNRTFYWSVGCGLAGVDVWMAVRH